MFKCFRTIFSLGAPGICMGIYHNFDKLVKTHVNSVLQMSLCCFLTVSCPTNIIWASYIKQQPEHRSDYDYYD